MKYLALLISLLSLSSMAMDEKEGTGALVSRLKTSPETIDQKVQILADHFSIDVKETLPGMNAYFAMFNAGVNYDMPENGDAHTPRYYKRQIAILQKPEIKEALQNCVAIHVSDLEPTWNTLAQEVTADWSSDFKALFHAHDLKGAVVNTVSSAILQDRMRDAGRAVQEARNGQIFITKNGRTVRNNSTWE